MNILYIAPRDPRIANTGSTIRTAFLWESLKRLGTVYTVIYPSKDIDVSQTAVRDALERDRIHVVPNKQTSWWNWLPFYISRKLMKNGSLALTPAHRMRRAIGWEGIHFDCCVVRYIDQVANRVAWKLAPLYIDIDDLPTTVFDQVIKRRLPIILRPLASCFVRFVQWRCLRHAKGLWVTNETDLMRLKDRKPTRLLRNLAPRAKSDYRVDGCQEKLILTVGLMGYGPNSQGVSWFLRHVWPEVHREFPELTYAIAGGGLADSTRRVWESVSGVRVLGFVDDLDAVYERALAVVTPILSGAGTCVKTIEACKRGRKVLSTACAARGFSGSEMKELGVDVFIDATSFIALLRQWIERPTAARLVRQREILASAEQINSVDEFNRSVREMIVHESKHA